MDSVPAMKTRRIGTLDVSVVGLGCNNFGMRIDEAQTASVVRAALDAGVNYFDSADVYGGGKSEEFLGKALGKRRDEAIVATKFGSAPRIPEGRKPGSADWVHEACERSLTALGLDHIDHYQMHQPDPTTPIEETLGALDDLVKSGKVREIGCSNFTAEMIDEAARQSQTKGLVRFGSVQNYYSLLTRTADTDGVLDACRSLNVGFVPFFPLESGLLSGKYTLGQPLPEGSRLQAWGDRATRFINDERLAVVASLMEFASERGHTILELAISWLASNQQIATIIAGATSPEQVTANARAASWEMTADDLTTIEQIVATAKAN